MFVATRQQEFSIDKNKRFWCFGHQVLYIRTYDVRTSTGPSVGVTSNGYYCPSFLVVIKKKRIFLALSGLDGIDYL
jgi:hypothetical protein